MISHCDFDLHFPDDYWHRASFHVPANQLSVCLWEKACAVICAVLCLVTQSCPTLATPWTVARQAPLSMGEFSRQEYWIGLSCPPPGDLPNPGIEPRSLHCKQILYHLSHQGSPRILEWVAYPFSMGSSWPGIELGSLALQADSLPAELPGKPIQGKLFYAVFNPVICFLTLNYMSSLYFWILTTYQVYDSQIFSPIWADCPFILSMVSFSVQKFLNLI